jgi:hypothetical protein
MADPSALCMQEASLRIGRLFDLLEELAECRRDFEALTTVSCTEAAGKVAKSGNLPLLMATSKSHPVFRKKGSRLMPSKQST